MSGLAWWGWVLFAVGGISLIAIIAALFLPDWGRPDYHRTFDEATGTPGFVEQVASMLNVPLLRADSLTLLQNGDCFYPAMLDAIRSARDTINFQVYIFEADTIGKEFMEAFKERARAGVQVRIMLDAFGSWRFPERDRRALSEAGCKLQFFRPIRIHTLVRAFKRDHRRAIVVDGRIGFIGGAAVADKWRGNARTSEEWRDTMLQVTGQLASGVQAAFASNWLYSCGEVIGGPQFFPEPVEPPGAERRAGPVGLAVVSSPADAAQPIRLLFWISMMNARRRIYISNSYFIPDRRIRRAVMARARAGVDVRILVPGPVTDAKPVRLAGQSYYEQLLEAGVRIFEYQGTMMHAKTIAIDGIWSIIGSANMDERSMELNEEANLCVADAELAKSVERGILADLERSREIDLDQWRRRSPLHRVGERLAKALIEQY